MFRSIIFLKLLLCILNTNNSKACNNCEGKDYIVIFPENLDSIQYGELFVFISTTSDIPATVRCFSPHADWTNLTFEQVVQVRRQNITTVIIPGDFQLLDNEMVNKSLRITSDKDIFVYAANKRRFSGDMFLVYPTNRVGKNYIVASHESDQNIHVNAPFVAVAAISDDTQVVFQFKSHISVTFRDGSVLSGNSANISLNKYEVVHFKNSELSGTIIRASKDIVAVSGNTYFRDASIYGKTTGDYLAEQLVPVKYMSTKYIVVPSSVNDTESGEIVRIYSTESDTSIIREYNGSELSYFLQNPGDSVDVFLEYSSSSVFTANKDILVAQFGTSSTSHDDPYMLLATPYTGFMHSYEFLTPSNYKYSNLLHRLVIIANAMAIESTYLDNMRLISTEWSPVGQFFFINIQISEGTHTVHTSAKEGLLWGFVYGERHNYGYASSIGRYLCETRIYPGDGPLKIQLTGNSFESIFQRIDVDKVPTVSPLTTTYATTVQGCGRECKSFSNCVYFTFQDSYNVCETFDYYIWRNSFRVQNETALYEKRYIP